MLAFEVGADYVVVRREPTGAEVAAQLDAEAPFRLPSEMTEDEAISRYFEDDWSPGWGPELYVIGGKAPKE